MSETASPEALRVTVVGLGYVGLTTAMGLAALGHEVTGVDSDCGRLAMLGAGRVPMHEPGLQAALREQPDAIALTASLDDALARKPHAVMIAVQTPGEGDIAYVEEAAAQIGRSLRGDAVVVVRSTAPLGTTLRVAEIVERERGARTAVASNPEFLVEGKAYEAFLRPDRIVVGADDDDAAALMRRLYAGIDAPLIVTDIATAELAKYAANAYLATQISFINEIADLASAAGADAGAVSRIIKLDKRVGERAYLNPGIGFGGSCLPKDLRALTRRAEELGLDMRLARAVNAVNEERAERLVVQLREVLGNLDGRRIAVWGLAFKGGTNDVRESPAINVVLRLAASGATVRAYDPLAEPAAEPLVGAAALCDGLYEPLEGAEALLVVTDCEEFKAPDFGEMRRLMAGTLIVDGRGVISKEAALAAGFAYVGTGARVGAGGGAAREASEGQWAK